MIKLFKNFYDYLNYGKIVYKSSSGSVIRKNIKFSNCCAEKSQKTHVRKTVFNSKGKIEKIIDRALYADEHETKSFFIVKKMQPDGEKKKIIDKCYVMSNNFNDVIDLLI